MGKSPGRNDQYTLSMMNWYHFISNPKKKMYKRRKNFHLNAYINTCKTKNKRKNLYRPSQTKPSVEF